MKKQTLLKTTKIVYLLIGLSISLVVVTDVNSWWDNGWSYKRLANVTNPSSNYQIPLNLTHNIHYNNTDCSDIRFTNSAEDTELDYWVENYSASNYCFVWVETKDVNNFYLYYGNTTPISSATNITNTFIYGVDWTKENSLPSAWLNTTQVTYSFSSTDGITYTIVTPYDGWNKGIYLNDQTFNASFILRTIGMTTSYIHGFCNSMTTSPNSTSIVGGDGTNFEMKASEWVIENVRSGSLGSGSSGGNSSTNTLYTLDSIYNVSDSQKLNVSGQGIVVSVDNTTYSDVHIGYGGLNVATINAKIKQTAVRNYTSVEPIVVLEAEEQPPPSNNIISCRALNQTGVTYNLTTDILNYGVGDCFSVSANNITLECNGFKIDGTGSNDAIDLGTSDYFTIRNCNITDWGIGIRGDGACDFNSSNNEINDMAGYSLLLKNANNPNVEDNDLWLATNGGIRFESMNNPYISNVNSWNNGIGISIGDGQGGLLEDVYSFDNTDIGFKFYQTSTLFAVNCSMINNVNSGLWLSHANVTFSIIQDNGIGVRIGSGGACIIYNNLLNNTVNFQNDTVGSNHQWNTTNQTGTRRYSSGTNIGGNYYTHSNSSGYSDNCVDSDTDGFCDNSYQLSEFNIDYLPYSDEFVVTTTTTTIPTTTTTTIELLPIGNYTQWYCSDNLLVKNYTAKGENSTYEYIVCEYNCSSFLGKARCNYEPFVVWIVFIVLLIGIAVGLKFIINHNIFD